MTSALSPRMRPWRTPRRFFCLASPSLSLRVCYRAHVVRALAILHARGLRCVAAWVVCGLTHWVTRIVSQFRGQLLHAVCVVFKGALLIFFNAGGPYFSLFFPFDGVLLFKGMPLLRGGVRDLMRSHVADAAIKSRSPTAHGGRFRPRDFVLTTSIPPNSPSWYVTKSVSSPSSHKEHRPRLPLHVSSRSCLDKTAVGVRISDDPFEALSTLQLQTARSFRCNG